MKNQRGCKVNSTFVGVWGTKPHEVYGAAKAKAHSCLNDPAPKLTALERAFYDAAKCETSPTSIKASPGSDTKANSRSSSCPEKPGKPHR